MSSKPLNLRLHRKQTEAFLSTATERLYGGAAGGGKSHLMRVVALTCCAAIPGFQCALFRRTFDELYKGHMIGPKGFRSLLADWVNDGLAEIVGKEIRFLFNGSTIHMCHCENEDDVYKYQSAEFHALLMDELTTFTEFQYRFLRSRVRAPGLQIPDDWRGKIPFILTASNPGNAGHEWVKRLFVDAAPPMSVWQTTPEDGGMTRQYIPARLEDNPSMTDDDPGYEARLSGMGSPALVRAYREGDWDIFQGAYFPEFSRHKHVVPPQDLPPHWLRFGMFDWGSYRPFCYLWAAVSDGATSVFPKGSVIIYREYYGASGPNLGLKMRVEDVAQAIVAKTREELAYSVCDPACFQQDGGPSIAEAMAKAGLRFRPGDKRRIPGWQQVRSRLQGEEGKPRLFIFDTCLNLIRTIPLAQHDDGKPEDMNTEAEDHALDALRYGCMSRPYIVAEKPKLAIRDIRTMTLDDAWKLTGPKRSARL